MWIQMWVTSSTHQKWNWDWHWVPKTWWRVAQKRKRGLQRGRTMEVTDSQGLAPPPRRRMLCSGEGQLHYKEPILSENPQKNPMGWVLWSNSLYRWENWTTESPGGEHAHSVHKQHRQNWDPHLTPQPVLRLSELWTLACFCTISQLNRIFTSLKGCKQERQKRSICNRDPVWPFTEKVCWPS